MTVSPDAFKAYDIRGLYPQELDAGGRPAHRRRPRAQLGARRLAVGHDPACRRPSWPPPRGGSRGGAPR